MEQVGAVSRSGAIAVYKFTGALIYPTSPPFICGLTQMASNSKINELELSKSEYEKLMNGVLVGRMLFEGSQTRQFLSVMKELEPLLLESDWPQFRRVVIQSMVGGPYSAPEWMNSAAFSYCNSALWEVFVESHPNHLSAVKVYTNQKVLVYFAAVFAADLGFDVSTAFGRRTGSGIGSERLERVDALERA